MTTRPPTRLLWFAVLGGATAWTVQFVANLFFTFSQCNDPNGPGGLSLHAWQIGLSVGALVIGGAATVVSVQIFRRNLRVDDVDGKERRGDGSPPPRGRIHFLSIVALTVNFLALTIIVMTAVGAPLLRVCQQS